MLPLVLVLVIGVVYGQSNYSAPGCQFYYQPVKLIPGTEVNILLNVQLLSVLNLNLSIAYDPFYKMATWYCPPTVVNDNNQRLVVVVHGGTYGHIYNDFPVTGYSHVETLQARGYHVVNLDKLGNGLSDHPPPELVTITTAAYTVHQLITKIKTGNYLPLNQWIPTKMFYIGHSLGSMTGAYLTAWWPNDVQGFVMTGWAHAPSAGFGLAFPYLIPTQLDPVLAGRNLPLGYLTLREGARNLLFYYLPNADATVINLDELTKETATPGEVADALTLTWSVALSQITIPIYEVNGVHDKVVCPTNILTLQPDCTQLGSITMIEPLLYPLCPDFRLSLMANAGHDLSLHKNRQTYYAMVNNWLDSH